MNSEEIKKVIVDQQEEVKEYLAREKIISRDLDLAKLKKFLSHPNILVISGVRRSGKSTLALQLFQNEKHGYLNFDDERLAGFGPDDFNKMLEAFFELFGSSLQYFIFDEIQNIPAWELFLNRLRRNKKIIITGSNANLLSGELASRLTGRYLDFNLYPFSFREFLKFKEIAGEKKDIYSTKEAALMKKMLAEYLELGGFPEAIKFGQSMTEKIYSDILNKDILFRRQIRNTAAFKELAQYLLSNFGQEMSYSKLKNIFSVKNIQTVKNYVDYLSASFLVFILNKFSYQLKQQVIAAKKIYGVDTGMINAISFQFSPNFGRLMENAVFLKLQRQRASFEPDLEVYFWKDYSGKEVDFVLKKGRKAFQLIQVCQSLNRLSTRDRELKSLVAAGEELNCSELLVITWNEKGETEFQGKLIKFLPLWQWMLS